MHKRRIREKRKQSQSDLFKICSCQHHYKLFLTSTVVSFHFEAVAYPSSFCLTLTFDCPISPGIQLEERGANWRLGVGRQTPCTKFRISFLKQRKMCSLCSKRKRRSRVQLFFTTHPLPNTKRCALRGSLSAPFTNSRESFGQS